MEAADVRVRLDAALAKLVANDSYLLTTNLGERCIATRLSMYLQEQFPEHHVDCEYNRAGNTPKRLDVPAECANGRDNNGEALVVPDVIVHRRGAEGPNVLVLELKKSSNPQPRDCDRARIHAFRHHLAYEFGALVECETRAAREPAAVVAEWMG